MALTLKTRQAQRWNFAPLSPLVTIDIGGDTTVPGSQDYCPDTDTYTPDYTLAPLVLQPRVSAFSVDGTAPSGEANSRLSGIAWYEVIAGVARQIVASTTPGAGQVCGAGRASDPYDITGVEASTTSGRLIVKRNFPPGEGATLVFTALLEDTRTGQFHDIRQTFSISTIASWAAPTLCLDCPSVTSYNPIRSADMQTIRAALMMGGKPCVAANRLFRWEVWDGSAWHTYGLDTLDYWAEVSADTSTIEINRRLMGEHQRLRCSAYYDRGGNPASAASPLLQREFTLERVLRNITLDTAICNLAQAGSSSVAAKALISDGQGSLTPEQINAHFVVRWKTAANSANLASPSYTLRAVGAEASIPTTSMSGSYGMITECEVEDRGPLKAWADSDGAILTDSDGSLLLIK